MPDLLATILATATVGMAIAGLRRPAMFWVLAGLSSATTAGLLALALLKLDTPQIVLPLAIACLMLGVIAGAARGQRSDTADGKLRHHLERCRRRKENASALVVALPDGARLHEDVMGPLRVTDSAVVTRVGKRWELHALFDGDDVARHIVEARLRLNVTTSNLAFGWATFPTHGLTLEALFDYARAEAGRAAPVTARRAEASSRAPDDPDPAA